MRALFVLIFLSSFLDISAQSHKSNLLYQSDKVKIYAMEENMKEFSNAELYLDTLMVKKDTSEILVNFTFKNYKLGAQSIMDSNNLCANSPDGQHIHFIQDKDPYVALYNGGHKFRAQPGHHVFLAFLSRSYHLSLKHPKSYLIHEYTIGNAKDNFNEKKPHLFYSRPKGTYVNKDTAEILIDYYLINCNLSEKGFKVKVNIDDKHIFTVDKWTPLIVKGLQVGEHHLELTLLDKKGKAIQNSINTGKRKFILSMNPK